MSQEVAGRVYVSTFIRIDFEIKENNGSLRLGIGTVLGDIGGSVVLGDGIFCEGIVRVRDINGGQVQEAKGLHTEIDIIL